VASKTVTVDLMYGTLPKTDREGYIFDGWFTTPCRGEQITARSHGTWHMSAFRPLQSILSNRYLESLGFPDLLQMYEEAHTRLANRRIREVRTVV